MEMTKKVEIVGPTEITKSNVGRRQGRGCQGNEGLQGGMGWVARGAPTQGPHSSERRGWVLLGTLSESSGQPVPQSRGSAQPDGSKKVFCHLSISRMVLGHRNRILGGKAQSSSCPHPLWGPTGSSTGLSPAQDTDLSPETRDMMWGGYFWCFSLSQARPVLRNASPSQYHTYPDTVSKAADSSSHQNRLLVRDVPSQGHRELGHVANHGNLFSCSHSPPQAPILLPQMERERREKIDLEEN